MILLELLQGVVLCLTLFLVVKTYDLLKLLGEHARGCPVTVRIESGSVDWLIQYPWGKRKVKGVWVDNVVIARQMLDLLEGSEGL
ncbi:hypothetical protein LCGC14_0357050 [marine sediment metagenome]|uniref:Uncharacterized protein n=1 Tax=marine sediment metagenome TaxID=412755 RepID=A0A0F9VW91_9ZZZZ